MDKLLHDTNHMDISLVDNHGARWDDAAKFEAVPSWKLKVEGSLKLQKKRNVDFVDFWGVFPSVGREKIDI